jgi:hypothetical protein
MTSSPAAAGASRARLHSAGGLPSVPVVGGRELQSRGRRCSAGAVSPTSSRRRRRALSDSRRGARSVGPGVARAAARSDRQTARPRLRVALAPSAARRRLPAGVTVTTCRRRSVPLRLRSISPLGFERVEHGHQDEATKGGQRGVGRLVARQGPARRGAPCLVVRHCGSSRPGRVRPSGYLRSARRGYEEQPVRDDSLATPGDDAAARLEGLLARRPGPTMTAAAEARGSGLPSSGRIRCG